MAHEDNHLPHFVGFLFYFVLYFILSKDDGESELRQMLGHVGKVASFNISLRLLCILILKIVCSLDTITCKTVGEIMFKFIFKNLLHC